MRRMINTARSAVTFVVRVVTAWRYMRRLNYSRKLAWAMAAR